MALPSIGNAIVWYRALKPLPKSALWAFFFTLPALASALLGYYLKVTLDSKDPKTLQYQLWAVVGLFVVLACVRRYIELRCEVLDKADQQQRNALAQTYISLDGIIATCTNRLHSALDAATRGHPESGTELVKVLLGSLEHIQALVNGLYEVVQGQFSQAGSLVDEIDFEVTFMTKSYRDGEITIYASQNRDHRAPTSLLLRRENKYLYNQTVTAEVYGQVRPSMRVIEDTTKNSYHAVYQGQLDRIKSSIVYPVLSDKSELLGTLVVHCNKAQFFKASDMAFWRKVIEPFAKRAAFEKMKFDYLLTADLAPVAQAVRPETLRPDH